MHPTLFFSKFDFLHSPRHAHRFFKGLWKGKTILSYWDSRMNECLREVLSPWAVCSWFLLLRYRFLTWHYFNCSFEFKVLKSFDSTRISGRATYPTSWFVGDKSLSLACFRKLLFHSPIPVHQTFIRIGRNETFFSLSTWE